MSRISLTKLGPENPNHWSTFKEHIASLIIEALLLLRQRNDLVKDEKILNRLLFFCVAEANLNFGLPLPAYDAHNPPHTEDKQKAKREDNFPDFYWTLMDHEAYYQGWYRTYALECKRLDEKVSSKWIYTKQYVTAGILRFLLDEKGYGKGCESGAMAGYIQDMELDHILEEVNSYLMTHEPSIPTLVVPVDGWQSQGVTNFNHTFNRSFIPTHFSLEHFWIDMKDCLYIEQDNVLAENENKTT